MSWMRSLLGKRKVQPQPDLPQLPAIADGSNQPMGGDAESDPSGALDQLLSRMAPYPVRQVKPYTRVVLRIALWGAVVVGAVSGIVGVLISLSSETPVDAQGAQPEDLAVPASVGGTAEMVVEEWLLATTSDVARVSPWFVEAPALPPDGSIDGREVLGVRTVSGEKVTDGYWAVTVAVDLIDQGGQAGDGEQAGQRGDAQEGEPSAEEGGLAGTTVAGAQRWYVEIGIVGDENGALAALRTPAVVPPPEGLDEGWSSEPEEVIEPAMTDLETITIQDFLRAVLVGEGDVSRYVAAGVEISSVDPPPFSALEVTALTAEPLDGEIVRFQATVEATTAGGGMQPAAYEVVAEWREGRLEVLGLWGAASLGGQPEAESAPSDDASGESGGDGTGDSGEAEGDGETES